MLTCLCRRDREGVVKGIAHPLTGTHAKRATLVAKEGGVRMMNRRWRVHAVAALVAVLASGCAGVFDGRSVPTLGVGDDYALDLDPSTYTLDPGETLVTWYDLTTAQGAAIYFVIDAGDLRLRTPSSTTFASSSTGFYFAAGSAGIIPASEPALGTADVSFPTSCIGPCIIVNSDQAASIGTGYVRITNPFTTDLDVRLWVFSKELDDTGEPANDVRAGATLLTGGTETGAIETIDDVDVYEVLSDGDVTVFAPTTFSGAPSSDLVTLRVEALDTDGDLIDPVFVGGSNPVTIAPDGDHTFSDLLDGEFIRVRALDGRAASAEYSRYDVDFVAAVP